MIQDIQLVLQEGGVLRALDRVARLDTPKVFRRLRPEVRKDQREHAMQQMGPDGAWPPLAPSTKERRARMARKGKRGRGSTRMLGRLPGANAIDITRDRLRAMSRVRRWSMVHQGGARVGRGSVIPRRQYLWISPRLQNTARREFELELLRAFGGGR